MKVQLKLMFVLHQRCEDTEPNDDTRAGMQLTIMQPNGNWSPDWFTSACWSRPGAGDPYQRKWFDRHKEFSFIPLGWGHEGSQGFGHNGRLFQSWHKLHFNPGDKNDGRATWKDTIKYLEPCEGRPPFSIQIFLQMEISWKCYFWRLRRGLYWK